MSVNTNLYTKIVFNRKTYNSKIEVQNDLETAQELIAKTKERIKFFGFMTEPEKYKPEDETSFWFVDNSLDVLIEELQELTITEYKLEMLLNKWDLCHDVNGVGIAPPAQTEKNKSYIDGDFVKTNLNPEPNKLQDYENMCSK